VHLRGRPAPADPQLGTDLDRDGLPLIDTPQIVLIGGLLQAAHGVLADGQQLACEGSPLGLLGITHQIE
jgi:hypothetical protein